jgi:glutamate/tyrosine decarboxylase-like PLP-dependent enzyme
MSKTVFPFPKASSSADELLEIIRNKKLKDIDWHKGKAFCLIYHPGDEREQAIKSVFDQYFADNALNPTATPSLAELENETVSMCADLFSGDENVCGNITTGGTESILLSVKTARDFFRKKRPEIKSPNVVLPASAHPAFMKAFHYFGVDFTVTKLSGNYRADVAEMEKAIDKNTIMLVGSAPAYPHGVMDPIEEIAALAKRNNILCHVDACIGGFLLPFIKDLGYKISPFDFAVDGVTSISADLHKYGYSPKGASVIMYKNHEIRRHQFSLYTKWNGGIYGSPTMTGTRPGGNIAGAWAAIKSIGYDGYLEMARATMQTTELIKRAVIEIEEIELIGEPDMSIVAFKSEKIDVFVLADELNKLGWHFERQQLPPSLHFTVNYIHRNVAETFINDLKKCIAVSKENRMGNLSNKIQTSVVKGLSKILPEGTIAALQKNSTPDLENTNKAAMYGMMGALSGTDDLDQIVLDFLDKIYTPKK